jgi:hypothetical protein
MYRREKIVGVTFNDRDEIFAQAAHDMAAAAQALNAANNNSGAAAQRAEAAALRAEASIVHPVGPGGPIHPVGPEIVNDDKRWHHEHSSVPHVARSIIIISALMAAFLSYGFFSTAGGFPVLIIAGVTVQRATLLFAAFASFALSLAMALWADATLFLYYPVVAEYADRKHHSHTFAGVLAFLAAVWCFIGFGLVFGAFFITIDRAADACFNSYPYVNGTQAQNDCVSEQGAIAIIVIALALLGIIALVAAIIQLVAARRNYPRN